jgi:hypothetical protein
MSHVIGLGEHHELSTQLCQVFLIERYLLLVLLLFCECSDALFEFIIVPLVSLIDERLGGGITVVVQSVLEYVHSIHFLLLLVQLLDQLECVLIIP